MAAIWFPLKDIYIFSQHRAHRCNADIKGTSKSMGNQIDAPVLATNPDTPC